MKLTKEMKNISKEWLDNLVNLTEFGKAIPTVTYNYENGLCFGISEARRLLDVVATTDEWDVKIAEAISSYEDNLVGEARSDRKIVGKARIIGLKAALSYAECIELSGGMWIKERRL